MIKHYDIIINKNDVMFDVVFGVNINAFEQEMML